MTFSFRFSFNFSSFLASGFLFFIYLLIYLFLCYVFFILSIFLFCILAFSCYIFYSIFYNFSYILWYSKNSGFTFFDCLIDRIGSPLLGDTLLMLYSSEGSVWWLDFISFFYSMPFKLLSWLNADYFLLFNIKSIKFKYFSFLINHL